MRTAEFLDVPQGTLRPQIVKVQPGYYRLERTFDVRARFGPPGHYPGCSCASAVYRQYVRGEYRRDGEEMKHELWTDSFSGDPQYLDKSTYKEDYEKRNGKYYGHREDKDPDKYDKYLPEDDRANGCEYRAWDRPFVPGWDGTRLYMKLEFWGILLNPGLPGNKGHLQERRWSVAGEGIAK